MIMTNSFALLAYLFDGYIFSGDRYVQLSAASGRSP